MHVAFPFLLPVATGIRIMYCMNDCLRDYQQEMKLRLFEEWEFHRNVMVQMPTGTGKTHLLAAIVREFLRGSGSRVWIVAHRRELVDQIEETVSRHGMSKEDGRVRVMSIQWLSRNRKEMYEEPDLIVIDEAHHALAETYRILWEKYPEARKLGMTATPCRLNGKGFMDLFNSLITSWTVAEFIGKGWLSSFDEETRRLVHWVLEQATCPVVLDADGLNCAVSCIELSRRTGKDWILTPHPGEMARLTGRSIPQIQENRVETATQFAAAYPVTLALKGAGTLVAQGSRLAQNSTGNPGMSRGGSGDVLAGLIAAFVAQGIPSWEAACAGVYLHGLAGDAAAAALSQQAMLPRDLLAYLPQVLVKLEQER